jgi:adenosylmethionine---8-amino-7-oxononanoate aminotransferase
MSCALGLDRKSPAEELVAKDRRHVWHPFAQMREYLALPPLVITGGRGGWLIDVDGREYLDGNASIWTNVHGHRDPDLDEALRAQLDAVAHTTLLGHAHGPAADLAAELVHEAPPGLGKVFYSDNGAGAVEVALKQSFQYWQLLGRHEKTGVIGMQGAYHGDTFGTMSVGDSGFFHGRFWPWCFASAHFPAPQCKEFGGFVRESDATESLAALRKLLARDAARTACVILEPSVQGAAGMRLQPPGFLRAAAAICAEHEVHLILDEVFTGFGRLGAILVCKREGVTPDFLCLAKGLSAGYLPLAATLTRDAIHDAFLGSHGSGRAFFHGHTFTGNPLACAVALESLRKLRVLVADGTLARRSAWFGREVASLAGHPHVAELRQRGFTAAVDLRKADGSAYDPEQRAGLQVCLRARAHGLILRPLGDSLLLVPPLCLTEEELTELVRRTRRAIDDVLPTLVDEKPFTS